ncbi:hypothetical protein F2Q69_00012257 [Brassica cretica]|uniref:Uncharacterized protein n=1 Tax=Brassica cretica TaxID=69181 RepID=A0A8S9QP41_BRACR|nr:hypothetical protein F2Q69_00012257 [Brassica cretica]
MITACGVTYRSTRWNGQARDVAMHAIESCGQPCVRWCVDLHALQSYSQPSGRGTWRRFCSSEERSVLVETSSRTVWTWVYLRRSRNGSDRRSRVWGQGHSQPKTLANAECLDDIAKLWIVRWEYGLRNLRLWSVGTSLLNFGRRSGLQSCSCLIVDRWFDLCLERFGGVTTGSASVPASAPITPSNRVPGEAVPTMSWLPVSDTVFTFLHGIGTMDLT